MAVHDWTRVDAGIFHAFHHDWITEISRALNAGMLPAAYYALPEQHAAGFGPDVLTLQAFAPIADVDEDVSAEGGTTVLVCEPKLTPTAETDMEFYRRKQTAVVIRHVSGDRVVAVIEIVSPGNKSTRHAMRSFVEKASDLLSRGVQLLIVDILPPGPRDKNGVHAEIGDDVAGQPYELPESTPLTLSADETALSIRTYIKNVAVSQRLPDMPLFLEPDRYVNVPLERTYNAAFNGMPARWRRVLENVLPQE